MPKNSGSMLHRFSVRSYDPRNVWFTIFGYVTATLATFFVGRDAENSPASTIAKNSNRVVQDLPVRYWIVELTICRFVSLCIDIPANSYQYPPLF